MGKQYIATNEVRKIKFDGGYQTMNVKLENGEDEFEDALREWKKATRKGIKPAAIILDQRQRIRETQADIIRKSHRLKKD